MSVMVFPKKKFRWGVDGCGELYPFFLGIFWIFLTLQSPQVKFNLYHHFYHNIHYRCDMQDVSARWSCFVKWWPRRPSTTHSDRCWPLLRKHRSSPRQPRPELLVSRGKCHFFWERVLFRTSLPKCLCEIDACPTPLCLLLPSYQTYPIFVSVFLSYLLFPATIPCIIVFSKPLWLETWPNYKSFWCLTKLYSRFVGRWSSCWIVGAMSYPGCM